MKKKSALVWKKSPFLKCQVGKEGMRRWDGVTKNIRNYLPSLPSEIEKNEGTIPKPENTILKTCDFIK